MSAFKTKYVAEEDYDKIIADYKNSLLNLTKEELIEDYMELNNFIGGYITSIYKQARNFGIKIGFVIGAF